MAKEKVSKVEEVKEVKVEKVSKPHRPGLGKNVTITVDTSIEDMLKWDKEGYNLRFADDDRSFIPLDPSVQKSLSPESFGNYCIASAIRAGIDVGMVDKGYDVMPGSATDLLRVGGKKQGMSYYFQRKDQVAKSQAEGWKVCTDPDVQTSGRGSGSVHNVGGGKNPELILMEKPSAIVVKEKAVRTERRRQMTERNKSAYKEKVAQLGGKGVDASFGD